MGRTQTGGKKCKGQSIHLPNKSGSRIGAGVSSQDVKQKKGCKQGPCNLKEEGKNTVKLIIEIGGKCVFDKLGMKMGRDSPECSLRKGIDKEEYPTTVSP